MSPIMGVMNATDSCKAVSTCFPCFTVIKLLALGMFELRGQYVSGPHSALVL